MPESLFQYFADVNVSTVQDPLFLKHPNIISVFKLAVICIIIPNAHKTLDQRKVISSLQLAFWK